MKKKCVENDVASERFGINRHVKHQVKALGIKLGRNFRVFFSFISFWDGKEFETFTMETENWHSFRGRNLGWIMAIHLSWKLLMSLYTEHSSKYGRRVVV